MKRYVIEIEIREHETGAVLTQVFELSFVVDPTNPVETSRRIAGATQAIGDKLAETVAGLAPAAAREG